MVTFDFETAVTCQQVSRNFGGKSASFSARNSHDRGRKTRSTLGPISVPTFLENSVPGAGSAWFGRESTAVAIAAAIERYVLLEELLAAGAPVGAHWVADRQSGPTLLKYGSDAQREAYLPGMARGEIYCCIGMSEPNAGSDLASVRTRAEKLPDGRWKINGQKIWTTNAHRCRIMIALVRTRDFEEKAKHAGLSQFIIELETPGVTIQTDRPQSGRENGISARYFFKT